MKNKSKTIGIISIIFLFLGITLPYYKVIDFGIYYEINLFEYGEGKILLVLIIINILFIFKDKMNQYFPNFFKYKYKKIFVVLTVIMAFYSCLIMNKSSIKTIFTVKYGVGFICLLIGVVLLIISTLIKENEIIDNNTQPGLLSDNFQQLSLFNEQGVSREMDYSNYNKNSDEIWCSWGIILLSLYFFFPLGIYLIIKKQRLHRRNIFTMGNKTFTAAMSLFICALALYLPKILYMYGNYQDLKVIIETSFYQGVMKIGNLFIIIAIIVLIISLYQKSLRKKYRKYISLVVNNDIHNLTEISKQMGLSKDIVIKDLTNLIVKRYLANYDINEKEDRIFNIEDEKKAKEEKIKNTRVVICPNCNASNKLEEKVGKCEFCNSYIE